MYTHKDAGDDYFADNRDLPDTLIQAYDSCAEWCAKRGLKGRIGDPLPNLLSSDVLALINEDPEAFEERVRQCAYALAMQGTTDTCLCGAPTLAGQCSVKGCVCSN